MAFEYNRAVTYNNEYAIAYDTLKNKYNNLILKNSRLKEINEKIFSSAVEYHKLLTDRRKLNEDITSELCLKLQELQELKVELEKLKTENIKLKDENIKKERECKTNENLYNDLHKRFDELEEEKEKYKNRYFDACIINNRLNCKLYGISVN